MARPRGRCPGACEPPSSATDPPVAEAGANSANGRALSSRSAFRRILAARDRVSRGRAGRLQRFRRVRNGQDRLRVQALAGSKWNTRYGRDANCDHRRPRPQMVSPSLDKQRRFSCTHSRWCCAGECPGSARSRARYFFGLRLISAPGACFQLRCRHRGGTPAAVSPQPTNSSAAATTNAVVEEGA